MKRFLVLLLVIAGGATWAVLAVPSNAATVNGQVITQNQLNRELTDYAQSPDYQCYENTSTLVQSGVAGAVGVNGAGQTDPTVHPTASTQFVKGYLDSQIEQMLITQIADQHHVAVTAADLTEARTGFEQQVTSVMQQLGQSAEADLQQYSCGHTSTAPLNGTEVVADTKPQLLDQVVHTSALYSNLEEVVGGIGDTTADLQSFFDAHRSDFDSTCFTVAQYSTQSAAQAARGSVYEGASFSSLATSTGGGPQGCVPLYLIEASAPNAHLQSLGLNTVSSPVHISNGYFLLEFTSKSSLPFATARSAVQQEAQTRGHARVQTLLTAAEKSASISLDPRYGIWEGGKNGVVTPPVPVTLDVLNPSANLPTVTSSASPFTGTGQSG